MFLLKFSFVCYVGLQWSLHLTIQLHVGFELLSRILFQHKSYRIKRSFEWILTTSSHPFPLGYQQRGPYPFSIVIQTINWFSFLQVSIFLWSPIWRLFCESSRQYENFSCHGAYSGRSLEGWKNQGKEFKLVVFNQK